MSVTVSPQSPTSAAPRRIRLHRLTPSFEEDAAPATYEYTDPFGDGSTRTYERLCWTTEPVDLGVDARSVVASWEARTPGDSWIEVSVRGREPDTPWLVLARWAETDDAIHRVTVPDQKADAYAVTDDEVVLPEGHEWTHAEVRIAALRPLDSQASWPDVDTLTVLASAALPDADGAQSQPSGVAHAVDVPRHSQQLYRDLIPELDGGGQNWCSPTSVTMVLEHWGVRLPADPAVPHSARHTFDHNYGGAGNWPFNTAYAATYGLRAFVTRLRNLAEAELFTRAGIPLVVGVAFTADQLDGAGYDTNGHLVVLIGFDEDGNPIVNDPASHRERSNDAVRTTYRRDQFLASWQRRSSGVVYVIHPHGHPLPARMAEANW